MFLTYNIISWTVFHRFLCAFCHYDINHVRVMAIAHGRKAESLVFCGLVGIMDPPRTSAITFAETMQVCARPWRETLTYNERPTSYQLRNIPFSRGRLSFILNF